MAQFETGTRTALSAVLERRLDRVADLASTGRIEAPQPDRIGQRRDAP
jgi:hypothetical protein